MLAQFGVSTFGYRGFHGLLRTHRYTGKIFIPQTRLQYSKKGSAVPQRHSAAYCDVSLPESPVK